MKTSGFTYKQIREQMARLNCHLCNDEAVQGCLRKTALGLPWSPQSQGGGDPYLCPADEETLCYEIQCGADELASCPTDFILNYAYELKLQRSKQAVTLLTSLGCSRLAKNIIFPEGAPSQAWLTDFARRHSLRIRCCEQLEDVRRRCCDRRRLLQWFQKNMYVLQSYHPDLIINMDETSLSSNRKYRVIVPDGMFPVVPHERRDVHMTGIVTFSSGGKLFRTGIILPGLKNLPAEFGQLEQHCHIYSSRTGWMTKSTFELYALNLAAEVEHWREEMPPNLRNQRVLLILDGHSSRKSSKAILHLQAHKIDVLVFPGHATHVIQPFDVGLAANIKYHLGRCIRRRERELENGRIWATSAAGARRFILAASFLEAVQKSVTFYSASEAFYLCGLRPINIMMPMSSHLMLDDAMSEHQDDWLNGSYFCGLSCDMRELLNREGINYYIPFYGYFLPFVPRERILGESGEALLTEPFPYGQISG